MTDTARIPATVKLAYGIGQMSEGIKSSVFGYFVLFYYSQLLGLSGTLAGTAILIALAFDAVSDPLMGSISDRWRSRWGRRHPFLYASAVPLAICFYMLFAPPVGLGQMGLFLWLTIFGISTRLAITLFSVPHQALGAELSNDFGERTSIVQFRQALGTVGSLVAFAIAFGLFFTDAAGGQANAGAYPSFAATLSVLMAGVILVSAFGTHSQIARLPQPEARADKMSAFGLFRDIGGAFQNRSFRWFYIGVIVIFLMVGVDSALSAYMNSYFWQLDRAGIFLWLIAFPIGLIAGSFFTRAIHQRFDKRPAVVFGTAWWSLCQIVPVCLFLLGWFPAAGTTTLLVTLVCIRFVQGMGTVQSLISAGAMIADIADEHDLKTGKRQEGVYFGALSFAGKVSTGLGTFVAGIALDLIAWPRGAGVTAADIPYDKLVLLGLLYGPIISGFAVVAIWCYTRYPLTRDVHGRILIALAERRAAATAPETVPSPRAAE